MNTYTVEWTEYLKTGNARIPTSLEVLCVGSLPIKAETQQEAEAQFKATFPRCWIISPEKAN
jgi:hypothetical protein